MNLSTQKLYVLIYVMHNAKKKVSYGLKSAFKSEGAFLPNIFHYVMKLFSKFIMRINQRGKI